MRRIHDSLTARAEQVILRNLCRHMPSSVTPDQLTGVGVLGAAVMCLCYALASWSIAFLWVGILGLIVNWLGDSLDGSLARYRSIERPQYGFFLDHTVDGFAMAFVAIGVGLSPMAHLWCALLTLVGYYLLAVLSLTTCLATGVFKISFGGFGPTEIRLGIILSTMTAAIFPIAHFNLWEADFTIYDGILLALAMGLLVTAVLQTIATTKELAAIDPPRR